MFGWSLPPGCGTLPGEEPDGFELQMAHRCKCGSFLPAKPDRTEPWEDSMQCDGKTEAIEQEISEGEIQILGESYRGKTYKVHIASCGLDHDHAPHKQTFNAGVTSVFVCRKCGKETKKG